MKRAKANNNTNASTNSTRWFALFIIAIAASSTLSTTLSARADATSSRAPELAWKLVAEHPHDPQRFTQGFMLHEGKWLESSGGFGNSFLVLEDVTDHSESVRFDLPPNEFAEGATFAGDSIWLITWRNGIAREFDESLNVLRTVSYSGEGWGLAFDGERLVMSDGSHRLQWRDPKSFERLATMPVHDAFRPVGRLNEMIVAHDLIWANIFGDTRIVAIDPDSGRVRGWLQLSALAERFDKPDDWDARENVLNGIAVDADTGHLHVTGKRWPVRYEIDVALPQ